MALDPYWMHDGPDGCQTAEAKLSRIAALCDEQRPFNPHLAADVRAVLGDEAR